MNGSRSGRPAREYAGAPYRVVARRRLGVLEVLVARVFSRRSSGVPADAVYVGRPTPFGNPFVIGRDGSREQVVARYREWLLSQPELLARVRHELRNKDLVCWCAPLACHADVLLEVANV